ncbi:MAG: bifunctional helix-turn-helix domain-containing protein/methylated-DNA--[protein]-cysteine S-methyltransferase [Desulfobacterales bacterium]|jgi:AraC family transcriptional regulator of adaptative response/methylated-DNA-[protein]-cysteine methyltransferase|nr:bifunctional helix-turn-helix domain-containing protein/methylated-DNA--[protein]-cysteine S-methyltransferase [Desulfobacterales bacterium]
MKREDFTQACRDYARVEKAIAFIEARCDRQPDLKQIADHVGLSEYHFQRLFNRWVGISPKRFLQFLTKEHVKRLLQRSASLLDAALDAGLSGPGRLHDLFVVCEAVTPGEFKSKGKGLTITYGFHDSPFGECLIAITARGICWLAFVKNEGRPPLLAELKAVWNNARLLERPAATAPLAARIYDPSLRRRSPPVSVMVAGTNFQIKVWEALLRIPLGTVVSYEDLARHIGFPKAVRAVGNAVGRNPVSFVIPCHRVVRKCAEFGNYGGGAARKKAMLGWEASLAAEE